MAVEPSGAAESQGGAAHAAEIFGAAPLELANELAGLLAGVVLDGADALEVSLLQLGVSAERATPVVNAVVDVFRARFAKHGACLRAFALQRVLAAPPPSSATAAQVLRFAPASAAAAAAEEREYRRDCARLDSQIATAHRRLARAVALRRAVDADQRALQRHVALLEDILARVAADGSWPPPGGQDELRMVEATLAGKARDFSQVQFSLEDAGVDEGGGAGKALEAPDKTFVLNEVPQNLGKNLAQSHVVCEEMQAKPALLKDLENQRSSEEELKDFESLSAALSQSLK